MNDKTRISIRYQLNKGLQADKAGSITVEAAFVMPIVIFTIFALIYLAFYLHDYCQIQGVTDNVLHKVAISLKHESDIATGAVSYENMNDRGIFYLILGSTTEEENQIDQYLQGQLRSGLFLSRITDVEVKADKLSIKITVEAKVQITIPYFQGLFDQFQYIYVNESYPVHNPAETIRCAEVIMDTGSSIKGVEELKEKLENFIGTND